MLAVHAPRAARSVRASGAPRAPSPSPGRGHGQRHFFGGFGEGKLMFLDAFWRDFGECSYMFLCFFMAFHG